MALNRDHLIVIIHLTSGNCTTWRTSYHRNILGMEGKIWSRTSSGKSQVSLLRWLLNQSCGTGCGSSSSNKTRNILLFEMPVKLHTVKTDYQLQISEQLQGQMFILILICWEGTLNRVVCQILGIIALWSYRQNVLIMAMCYLLNSFALNISALETCGWPTTFLRSFYPNLAIMFLICNHISTFRLMPDSALNAPKEKKLTGRQWFESGRASGVIYSFV